MQTLQKTMLSGETIVRDNARLCVGICTAKVTGAQTTHTQAVALVYAEALRSGAGSYKRGAFLDAEGKLGAHIRTDVEGGTVTISFQVVDTFLPATLKLCATMLTKPHFKASEIKRIKENLKNSLILQKEDARMRAYNEFMNVLVEKSDPRHRSEIDTLIKALDTISVTDIKKYHTQLLQSAWHYTTGGNAKCCALVTRTFTHLRSTYKGEPSLEKRMHIKTQTKRTVRLLDIPHKQNIEFSIGGPLPFVVTDSDYAAFMLGMNVLALYGGFTGRLMSTVREKEGLTYMIYGRVEKVTAFDEGFWRIATFFTAQDSVRGLTSTIREITRMHTKGITLDECTRLKQIMNTRRVLLTDSLPKHVQEVHAQRVSGVSKEDYEVFVARLQTLTPVQVRTVMKKYLNPRTLVICGAGPISHIQRELKAFDV